MNALERKAVHDDVIQRLRVAVEYERVLLRGTEAVAEIRQIRIDEIRARKRDLIRRRRRAFDGADDVDEAVVEGERVVVADGDDSFRRLARLDQRGEELRLRPSLCTDAVAVRAVDPAERAQVIDDDRDGEGRGQGAVHLAFSTSGGRSFRSGSGAPGAWPGGVYVASLPICSTLITLTRADLTRNPESMPPMSFPSSRYATYIGSLSPVGQRIGVDPCSEPLQDGQVLDLDDAEDVGRAKDVPDRQRRLLQAQVHRVRRQRRVVVIRVVLLVEEALEIGRRHSEFGVARDWNRRRRLRPGHDAGAGIGQDRVAAEREVQNTRHAGYPLPRSDVQDRAARLRTAVDAKPFGVAVEAWHAAGQSGRSG